MKTGGLQKNLDILKDRFENTETFTVLDAEQSLGKKKTTVYWILWNLVNEGLLQRRGKGLYSLRWKEDKVTPIISGLAKKVINSLNNRGYQFFISGIDILSVFMEHISESFPVLLFVYTYSYDEIYDLLSKDDIEIAHYSKMNSDYYRRNLMYKSSQVIMYKTREFEYAHNGLASKERAFIDLYHEVTKKEYPLPFEELIRIYVNMRRRIPLDTKRLLKIASRRNVYSDIRYIIENKQITDRAYKFVDILRSRYQNEF